MKDIVPLDGGTEALITYVFYHFHIYPVYTHLNDVFGHTNQT